MLDAPLLTAGERSSALGLGAEGAAVPAVEVELIAAEEHERRSDLDHLTVEKHGRVRQEPMAAVPAEHVEADRALARLVEDHVDDAPQLDAVQDDPLVEEFDPGHSRLILPGPGDVETHRIEKPSSPCGSAQVTSTSSTRAPRGPRPHHETIDSTRSSSPSKTASTEPSAAFRTQPPTPRDRARSRASTLKKTPCTTPCTTTWARFTFATPLFGGSPHGFAVGPHIFRLTAKNSPPESLFSDERHEAARDRVDDGRALRTAHDHLQPLAPAPADRNREAPARLELAVQELREPGSGRGDGDRRERGLVREAERPVADVDLHPVVAGRGEVLARLLSELGDALDRVHLVRELSQHSRLVARSAADVEHLLASGQPERLGDPRDHVRLRDRLPVADRKRGVRVSAVLFPIGDEELARHTLHGVQHTLVDNVPRAELVLDHPAPGVLVSAHGRRRNGRAHVASRR